MSRGKSTLAIGALASPRVLEWANQQGFSTANLSLIPQQTAMLGQFLEHMPNQMLDSLAEGGALNQLMGSRSGLSIMKGLPQMNHQQLNEFWIDEGFSEQNITTNKGDTNPWYEELWEGKNLDERNEIIAGLGEEEIETLSSQEGAWEPTSTTASAPNTDADELKIA